MIVLVLNAWAPTKKKVSLIYEYFPIISKQYLRQKEKKILKLKGDIILSSLYNSQQKTTDLNDLT